jgi:nucleotide-binding universal stress UspA family protein
MQEIKTILTPVDFSDNTEKIVRSAAYMAGTFKAKLHLVFVVQNFENYSGFFVPPISMPNLKEEFFCAAEEQIDQFINRHKAMLEEFAVTSVQREVLSGDIGEEILNYAAEICCNLIVMGTHGYKGLDRVLFGSVADKVVKNSCCPVMTINPYREECEKAQCKRCEELGTDK